MKDPASREASFSFVCKMRHCAGRSCIHIAWHLMISEKVGGRF